MRVFREAEEPQLGRDALALALGAAGGFAVGLLLSGRGQARHARPRGDLGSRLRERARSVAGRMGPGRLRRAAPERAELTALEDAVLDVLLEDERLSERAIDVGAIARGIVELSGSVGSEEEAEHAVRLANRLPQVHTVVNRLTVRGRVREMATAGLGLDETEGGGYGWTGRNIGMGRRRQGRQTDPSRPDDSQPQTEAALRLADRDQWVDEGLASDNPRLSATENSVAENRTRYRDRELDNQDPHDQHAPLTLDEQPQAFNTAARVGEGLEPGVELALERADVPLKPHGRRGGAGGEDAGVE